MLYYAIPSPTANRGRDCPATPKRINAGAYEGAGIAHPGDGAINSLRIAGVSMPGPPTIGSPEVGFRRKQRHGRGL